MRRFMVGCLATVGLLTLLMIVGTVALVGWGLSQMGSHEKAALPSHMLLTASIPSEFSERQMEDPLTSVLEDGPPDLRSMVTALDRAGQDGRVQGLALNLSAAADLPLYQAQELGLALGRFRQRGKKIVAFADTLGEGSRGMGAYLLASHADHVVLQPSGDVTILGLTLEQPYFADALAMLGITVRGDQRHEFKGGIDPLTGMAMPAAQKAALQAVLDNLMDRVAGDIARNRSLPADQVRKLIDSAPHPAIQAHGAKLIDAIGYWDDALSWLQLASSTVATVKFSNYRESLTTVEHDQKIALIHATGPVVRGSAGDGPFADHSMLHADDVARALLDAAKDPDISGIILRIDSPGGSYVASDTVFHAVEQARQRGKPVVASIGGMAASGGYFIAMAADRIVAQPTSLTGSIGVYSMKPVLTGLWNKIGVHWDGVQSGRHAGLYSLNRDFTPEEWQRFQKDLDRIYADFAGRVAKSRKLTPEQVDAVARGRIWSGAQAQERGLVDRLGDFNDAIAEARHLANLPADTPVTLVEFPRAPDHLEQFLRVMNRLEQTQAAVGPALPMLASMIQEWYRAQTMMLPASLMDPAATPVR